MSAEARVAKLEKKVDVITKALQMLLFEETEELPKEEIEELKKRLKDYSSGKKEEFFTIDELLNNVQSNHTQKSSKRD